MKAGHSDIHTRNSLKCGCTTPAYGDVAFPLRTEGIHRGPNSSGRVHIINGLESLPEDAQTTVGGKMTGTNPGGALEELSS